METKKIDLNKKYGIEIAKISNKLNQLEDKRIYELSGDKGDGEIRTNIQELRVMLGNLFLKIEGDLPSVIEGSLPSVEEEAASYFD